MDVSRGDNSTILELLKKRFRLLSLLQVKGPDIKGFLWLDKEGKEVDCTFNIIDSCSLHNDCTEFTRVPSSSPTTKTAQTVDDFKKIFEREFKIANLQPSQKAVASFSRHLREEVDRCIYLHKAACLDMPLKQDIALLLVADEFKNWLADVESDSNLVTGDHFSPCTTQVGPPVQQGTSFKVEDAASLKKHILFKNAETIKLLLEELKAFFVNRTDDLHIALEGGLLKTPLLFPHNQNKFVELFRRLKYNGFITSTPIEINNWICANFKFRYKRGQIEEVRGFNPSSVSDLLTKGKGEPTKKERICQLEWLPYKSHGQMQEEKQKEKN